MLICSTPSVLWADYNMQIAGASFRCNNGLPCWGVTQAWQSPTPSPPTILPLNYIVIWRQHSNYHTTRSHWFIFITHNPLICRRETKVGASSLPLIRLFQDQPCLVPSGVRQIWWCGQMRILLHWNLEMFAPQILCHIEIFNVKNILSLIESWFTQINEDNLACHCSMPLLKLHF